MIFERCARTKMSAKPPEFVVRGAHAADELRLALGLGNDPIKDLWVLIRDQAIDLAFHPFGPDGPDGAYRFDGRDAIIVVNSDKTPLARQRYTAAHELGHHLLHREDGKPLQAADANIEGSTTEIVEKEANAFAGYFLAPTEAMRRAFPGKATEDISVEDIVDLAHQFGTTYRTTIYRLHNSERFFAPVRDRLLNDGAGEIEFLRSLKGYDREDMPPGTALPPHYVLSLARMHAAGTIDDERLATLLRTDVETAVGLVGGDSRQADADAALAEAFGDLDAFFDGSDDEA